MMLVSLYHMEIGEELRAGGEEPMPMSCEDLSAANEQTR